MTLTDKIARTTYANLNSLPEADFDKESDELRHLYTATAELVLVAAATDGYIDRDGFFTALAGETDEVQLRIVDGVPVLHDEYSDKDYTSLRAWLGDIHNPVVVFPPLRHTDSAEDIDGLLVSAIGDEWFVTGTDNVDVATGAIIKHLSAGVPDPISVLSIAGKLIASTPVAHREWAEVAGETSNELVPVGADFERTEDVEVFSGVYFYATVTATETETETEDEPNTLDELGGSETVVESDGNDLTVADDSDSEVDVDTDAIGTDDAPAVDFDAVLGLGANHED